MSYNLSDNTRLTILPNLGTGEFVGYSIEPSCRKMQRNRMVPTNMRKSEAIARASSTACKKTLEQYVMIDSDELIEEVELSVSEIEELDQLAEETRNCSISWKDLKAELGL